MEEILSYLQSNSVYVFGQNSYGELGLGDLEDRLSPQLLPFFNDLKVKQVAAGNEHTAVLTTEGRVYTFGFNGSGQLGHGNSTSIYVPKEVAALRDKKIIYLGGANGCEHLLAISEDGTIYSCGYNNYGQLGQANLNNLNVPTLIPSFGNLQAFHSSCSYYHTIIVAKHKTKPKMSAVFSVGRNENGQLGQDHNNHLNICKIIPSLSNKNVAITACGLHHSLFVTQDGLIYSCGFNDNGQLGHGDTLSRNSPALIDSIKDTKIVEAACGYYHSLIRSNNGDIYSFGRNDKGQLGFGNSISASLSPKQIVEFKSIGENFYDEDEVPVHAIIKFVKIIKIDCGCYHSIVLSQANHIYTFGRGNHGQLGHGDTFECKMPKLVSALKKKKVVTIAGGFYHSVILVDESEEKTCFTLAADLTKLINVPNRSDVTFTFGTQKFHAHRCIIHSRCKELDNFISKNSKGTFSVVNRLETPHDMKKALGINSHKHVYLDMSSYRLESFEIFIHYLYTNTINPYLVRKSGDSKTFDSEIALDILKLADIFHMYSLKQICEKGIKNSVSSENVAKILNVSCERNSINLKQFCFNYIMENFGSVIGTQGFVELPQELLKEILGKASKKGVQIKSSSNNKEDQ